MTSGSLSLFDWLLLAMSVYVLYAGATGKGRLYSVENIKEDKQEEFKKFSQRIYIFLGITMILNSGTSILRSYIYPADATTGAAATTPQIDLGVFSFLTSSVLNIISIVALVVTLGLIVVLIVMMRKFVDKEAQAKAKSGQGSSSSCARGGCNNTLPSSAFEFDDEEKTEQK